MARMKVPAEELRKRRSARELKRKRSSSKPGPDGEDKGDDVCAICDNGGSLTCCDGVCKRSFHLDESEGSTCRRALGLTKDEAKAIIDTEEDFVCNNCKYKQHQCFICGLLGPSSSSSSPEVFQCEHDDCGRFYHPTCVAKLLYPDGEEATLFEHQVAAGLGFACPVHECCVCGKGEDKEDEDTQFAVCRRCPTTYHRRCLPEEILFKTKRGRNGSMRRAWEGVLPDRVLIYCMNHDIVRKLGTPSRDHIVFPDARELGEARTPQGSPMEQDVVSEGAEQLGRPIIPGTSKSPPLPAASDKNRCSCSGHMDSFAPKSLFMHPQPGSCGWIDDDDE